MPGSSLWLVPPEDSELYQALHELILSQIPAIYPIPTPPQFTPHVTLTADTVGGAEGTPTDSSSSSSSAQEWLDQVALLLLLPPAADDTRDLQVAIRDVEVGPVFFRKLTMQCEKTAGLCDLAARCRGAVVRAIGIEAAREWVRTEYAPHCSVMYSDLPPEEVQSKLEVVKDKVREMKQRHPRSRTARGGSIWLVPTYKDIEEWKPIARRDVPEMEWEWQT